MAVLTGSPFSYRRDDGIYVIYASVDDIDKRIFDIVDLFNIF